MKLFLFVVLFLFMFAEISLLSTDERIVIFPSPNGTNGTYLVKNVEESLQLTCVYSDKTEGDKKPIVWVLPQNVENRVVYSANGAEDSVSIFISHLEDDDSGEYKCGFIDEADEDPCIMGKCGKTRLSSYTSVHVFVKRKNCGGFKCSPIVCISERYLCDGHLDCPNGDDEHEKICGVDPCADKIKCTNGRCIPKEWCCMGSLNCTFRWDPSCCPHYIPDGRSMRYLGSPQHYMDFYYQQYNRTNATFFHGDISELNLLQSLIHTVIGCALVFIVVGPILIIAGCRLYLRHQAYRSRSQGIMLTSVPRLPTRTNGFPSVTYHPGGVSDEATGCEEFRPFSRTTRDGAGSDVILAHFRPAQPQAPPPYCEVMLSDHDDDPPPPYAPMNPTNNLDEASTESADKPENNAAG